MAFCEINQYTEYQIHLKFYHKINNLTHLQRPKQTAVYSYKKGEIHNAPTDFRQNNPSYGTHHGSGRSGFA
jgi:dTDP-4-dehydrorhamnose 3,5-epimerase-like enzyme